LSNQINHYLYEANICFDFNSRIGQRCCLLYLSPEIRLHLQFDLFEFRFTLGLGRQLSPPPLFERPLFAYICVYFDLVFMQIIFIWPYVI